MSMHVYIPTVAYMCMSDRTRLSIHTTCTNRRARGPALEQWDHHTATILQGQSVGGKPLSRRPTVRGPMLKKDNRPLIYDLGSLVRSPSTFFLLYASLYLSFYHRLSRSISYFLLALSGGHLAWTRGIWTQEGHRKFSALIHNPILLATGYCGHKARPSNFSRWVFRPTHNFRDIVICTVTCSSQVLQLTKGSCEIDYKKNDLRHGSGQACSI